MRRTVILCLIMVMVISGLAESSSGKTVKIPFDDLQDKIKGAWAAQVIGCTFGGPTEFRHHGTIIPDYQHIPWYDGYMKDTYENQPGLYDDIYMDLTFVDVFEKEGLDAPASSFANAFANADYRLWHANQAARYNILRGIMPPESGHWLNNPHADDIDFQIEADFAGIMCPGMVNASSEICDKIGHIMNYGDGWYGGVYVAAMYSLAFVSDDIDYIVEEALKVIPKKSKYYAVMSDVIKWHKQNPKDWKATWFKVHRKWSEDIGCPEGVFKPFNIDATVNSAWILLGLLYGDGDFGKTISISTRAGDDSDCNPASAAGILGTIMGYDKIPAYWKQGLAEVEPMDFKYTTISLNDVYKMSCLHAIKVIKRNGGKMQDGVAYIKVQKPQPVKLEVAFEGHYPIEKRRLGKSDKGEFEFEFEGIGFSFTGAGIQKRGKKDHVAKAQMYIDGKLVETSELPTEKRTGKPTLFWRYQLPKGRHVVKIKTVNPSDKIKPGSVIIYDDKPKNPKY